MNDFFQSALSSFQNVIQAVSGVAPGMNINHSLVQQLEVLRREFASYRVDVALRLDRIERRVNGAEDTLQRAGLGPDQVFFPSTPLHRNEDVSIIYGLRDQHSQLRTLDADCTPSRPAPSKRQTPDRATVPGGYTQLHHFTTPRELALRKDGNVMFLPFVLEKIASVSQRKGRSDRRTCNCGRPTFDLQCFREHHFDWCLIHQRPVVRDQHCSGGKHGNDCQPIAWEKPQNWDAIVKSSYVSGLLGTIKVPDLHRVLFPAGEFPEKYRGGSFMG
ncbi:hypothetical protein E8E13_010140 [Curvularia kusanoi]|uniref:Uncharacterized protein n=1 Tax=Curvularia kusanoi TaxID=90978 RepID=A0A9P4WCN3_CURKU|nr:hypothetical protein E8E13_010140 [Curvularia kusanoi]